ncbi:transposase [Streptomyces sp. NPDC058642]|uniref:transposase n=1 Tax=Streptomyces sp. NPDC058642 TaxID=3346572 RepID=UPI0036581218
MPAAADALRNAEYGQVADERVNHRNGYRQREWDTRAGTVELAVPKLRTGNHSRTGCWSSAVGPNRPSSKWSPLPVR